MDPDASSFIAQHVGNLSLSPLSDFTMHQHEQSFGLEVSFAVGSKHMMTGNASKRVLSSTIRELVDKLSEVEPYEPYWESLKELDLQERRLNSLHSLDEFCGRLVSLDASCNALNHLEGVPSSIRQLKVTSNLLSELTSWNHLMNLQYLDISNNKIKSLSGLKHLVHLRSIRADNNNISNLEDLCLHDGLLSIRARGNAIETVDFEGAQLRRLAELDLSGNKIRSVRNLDQLPCLATLKLQKNELETFESTLCCGSLRHLDLTDNKLAELDIGNLPALHLLHADRNCITRVLGFNKTRHLDSLSLREQSGDKPLDMSFLAAAYEVRKLFLSGNLMSEFEPQVDFLNLQLLEIANCGLRALPANLGQLMPNLRILNVNYNAITDLTPLRFIPRMKKLLAAGNRLADSTTITQLLTEYPHLSQLDLRDNPITQGFYAPFQMVVVRAATAATAAAAAVLPPPTPEPFSLADADSTRDAQYVRRLDEATRMRRRLYEVVLAGCCRRLKMLDGLHIHRKRLLARDAVVDTLIAEGLLPPDFPLLEEEDGAKDQKKRKQIKAQRQQEEEEEEARWPAEDSFA